MEEALECLPRIVLLDPEIEGREIQVQWEDQGVWPRHWWAPAYLTPKGHLFVQLPAWMDEGYLDTLDQKQLLAVDSDQGRVWKLIPAKLEAVHISGALWVQAFLRGEDADKFTV